MVRESAMLDDSLMGYEAAGGAEEVGEEAHLVYLFFETGRI